MFSMIFQIMDDKNQNMENNEHEQTVKHSDFSIDHILNRAGSNIVKSSENPFYCERTVSENVEKFQWLQCSRYCPPKIPRMHKKDIQKRQLGRHPRIPFTSHQLSILEQKFRESPYLSSEKVTILSKKLHLADVRVKIWFQNRRARERKEKNGVFGENKTTEDRKNISEETVSRLSTTVPTEGSNFCSRGLEIDHNSIKVPNYKTQGSFTFNIKSEVSTVPLDCSKTSAIPIPNNISDIFNSSGVSSPYILPNSILSQNVPLFIPFVNFSHSTNQDLKS